MASVLSTKVLTPAQQNLIFNSGLGLEQYDAIEIEYLDFEVPQETFDYLVFTSKNGVKAVLDWQEQSKGNLNTLFPSSAPMAFCVGSKTQALLEANGIRVTAMAKSASALKQQLRNYPNANFLLFSGNIRTPELPDFLKHNTFRFVEVICYNTFLNPTQFERAFDGILFFSPSGVESHASSNTLSQNLVFCIGETTANAAKKYTDQVIVASTPTVENVILQAINYFMPHD